MQTFAHVQSIQANVLNIDVNIPRSVNNNCKASKISIDQKLRRYISQKIQPNGINDTLRIVMKKCDVGINYRNGAFGIGGQDIYKPRMIIAFERINNGGYTTAGKELSISRTIHISEHASIAKRERLLLEGTDTMFNTLDSYIENILIKDLGI